MEGNFKRFQAGSTDDEYLGLFDEGVPMLAEKAREIAHGRMKGLLVDFGGVLTTNVFDSFRDFCVKEGLEAEAFLDLFRTNPEARVQLRRVETGEIDEDEFGEILGEMLGVEDRVDLVNRLFAGMRAGRADGGRGARRPRRPACAPAWSPTRSAPAATTARSSPSCTTAW